jgi:hypothetical protein
MANIARIRVTWSGTPVVGPGISTFYLAGAVTAGWPAALVTLFTALRNFVPNGVTWTIPGTVDLIEVTNGVLMGANSPGGGGAVASNGGAVDFKPGVGIRMRWLTAGVVAGRRVNGTTFLVPSTSQEIPNGVVQSTTVTSIQNAMNTYLGGAYDDPSVYSRPAPSRLGSIHPIQTALVPQSLTWVRTRRT